MQQLEIAWDREAYRLQAPQLKFYLFLQPWWLDAVCGVDEWDALVCYIDGKLIGALPIYVKRRLGISYIAMPPMTQSMGLWLDPGVHLDWETRIRRNHAITQALYKELERSRWCFYYQRFDWRVDERLALKELGYKQTTYYTYQIRNLQQINAPLDHFDAMKRRDYKKAMRHDFTLDYDLSPDDFLRLQHSAVAAKNQEYTLQDELVKRLITATIEAAHGRILFLRDPNGEPSIAHFLAWDEDICYYLMGVYNPEYQSLGISTQLFLEDIRFATSLVDTFDFEGTMNRSISNSYRRFGSVRVPANIFYRVRARNPLINLVMRYKWAVH